MKHSFTSVIVLAFLLHLPALVLGAPFAWGNRRAHYARSVSANETTTAVAEAETASTTLEKAAESTTLEKAAESTTTAFVNSTIIAKETATPTKTEAESTASATIIKGKSPLQTALTPKITDWNSCQSFLSSSGINLFVNQIDLNFQVVVNEVTVIQIIIDERGRARQTRVGHAFPQPTNYYPEFDRGKNRLGGGKNDKGKDNKGKATNTKSTVTVTATPVAEATKEAKGTTTTTTTKAEKTAATTATTTAASETTAASTTASESKSEETSSA
ncbi:hypothetical protein M407DRAFT_8192 [Tulasnella calospora MUT 4182]|uniref:Uncharacterized protein n=1 Tax=Tulasnella calospora MUT 4182 TaxID=1051891 RepID=A0A0C3QH53_9AGAM|nr:hypothetical protein M407DRAFT_8192 [Tulasnella calospora MUT 4182]